MFPGSRARASDTAGAARRLILGVMVGRARRTYGVEAPATTGVHFERYFRVHVNTLEALIVFIPAVWLFSIAVQL